ncbi:MAG TPA: 5'-methylthioadenosine/S-adenosylhomocysteine nucleosidase [Candidatus Limnocylindrales bacterium]|nr:5'-methylthioadenosine/S-adenosylhomocysteine nucleosidase [Candidatus Limnocylindrales bacterium]
MNACIGLIAAMSAEIHRVRKILSLNESFQQSSILFYRGFYRDKDIILARSGVGKVNAAVAAQVMIQNYKPKALLCFGAAGALSPECDIGDIVLGERLIQHDFGWYTAGHFVSEKIFIYRGKKKEKIPWFLSHPDLLKTAQEIGRWEVFGNRKIHTGVIVSGDQVICTEEKRKDLALRYQALATDMESAAIAHVAYLNQVPFLAIRAISDTANIDLNRTCLKKIRPGLKARKDFEFALDQSSRFVSELLKNINLSKL